MRFCAQYVYDYVPKYFGGSNRGYIVRLHPFMSDIPLQKLLPGRKKHRTQIEALNMSRSKTAAAVAFQKNRHYERYADVAEQEEERGLLDNGEYENPITVRSFLTLLVCN